MSFRSRVTVGTIALILLAGCDTSEPAAPPSAPAVAGDAASIDESCPTCVVGPVVVIRRSGTPEVHSWSVAAESGAHYLLRLDDLGTQGANAAVTLNGVTVPWRFDSTGARHQATVELVLLAQNTLAVRLTGKPGSQLRVALEPVAPVTATLTVVIEASRFPPTSGALQGPASGRITAPGIDCALVDDVPGGDCSEAYPIGTTVTLVQTPGERSIPWELYFERSDGVGGYGCSQDASHNCIVTLSSDSTLHVSFAPAPTYLAVTMVGPGVDADINGNEIMCQLTGGVQGGMCAQRYYGGVLDFSLRVYPRNSVFLGWSGACTGTDIFCPLTSRPGDTVRVTATFAAP